MIFDKDRKPTPPGEWEVDSNGKRFRFDGRCIEYEPTIQTSAGTLTRQQLEAMHAREKGKPTSAPIQGPSFKTCPLKTGMHSNCTKADCAWYTPEGCAMRCPHPAAGKKCPYKNTACANDCAMRAE